MAKPATAGSPAATVAVVIATRNRPDRLARCLEALAAQARMPDEVVVVDDASTVPLMPVVEAFRDRLPVRLLVQAEPGGPGMARDAGWRSATGSLVAFTDDDCRPDPAWLERLTAAAAANTVLVGRAEPDPGDGPMTSLLDHSMVVESDDGRFSTCNVAYPREVLERVGGFDPAFRLAYAEDTDLGQRALAAGATSRFVPDAVVYHLVERKRLLDAIRGRRRLIDMPRLVQRHPGLRQQICDGRFVRRSHRRLLGAGLGLVWLAIYAGDGIARLGPGGRGQALGVAEVGLGLLGVLAGRPWLRDAQGRIGDLGAAPARYSSEVLTAAVLDAYEVVVCTRGSLRDRSILL